MRIIITILLLIIGTVFYPMWILYMLAFCAFVWLISPLLD